LNNQHEDIIDMVGAYVLDALSLDERAGFEEHLKGCAQCQVEVAELQQVVDVLPLAVDLSEPPSSLRDRILNVVDSVDDPRQHLASVPGEAPPRMRRTTMRSAVRAREVWLATAAAIIIAGLVSWNVVLQASKNQQSAYQRDVVVALAGGARVSTMQGTSHAPGATASLVQPRSGSPYLIVSGLPRLPVDRLFEVWFVHNSVPRPAGEFTYSGSGAVVVRLPVSARGYSLTAVTDELQPGGNQPKGPQVLVGKLTA
jgi:anti-sigma factor RsiW